MKYFKHFRTVANHRYNVMKHCFKAGIPWQGLVHDLSKFSPAEFIPSAKYYEGTRSPNEREREAQGYSSAWLHHKGRNKHHFEYWNDVDPKTKKYAPVKMPAKYLAEMFCDRIGASKVYNGKNYKPSDAYDYYVRGNAKHYMHPDTAREIEELLILVRDEGEKAAFARVKQMIADEKKAKKAKKQ